jgi:hypothetical protein
MAHRKPSLSPRTLRALFGIVASSSALGACNAIFGIDEGHLVVNKDGGGSGASSSTDAGSGGSSMHTDASSTGGSTGTGGSGGGTQAAGGSSDSGAGDSGTGGTTATGGRTGTGGRGGTGTGGAATGGTAGTGGSTGVEKPPGVPGQVHCGSASCKLTNQVCCIETATGAAHCAASCDSNTQLPVSCDGAEDCTGGNKCCYPTGGTTASCMATCLGRVFCGSDRDCAAGQRCAPGTGALATVFVCTAVPVAKTIWCAGSPCDVGSGNVCCYDKSTKTEQCAKTCPSGNVRFACDGANDCATGESCCETRTGLGVFTGADCRTGSCGAGIPTLTCGGTNGCMSSEQCCLGASGSSCSSSCTSDVVCGTDADCPTGQSCSVVTDTAIGKTPGISVCTATP